MPFGTRVDTYRDGYEWIGHSLSAIGLADVDPDLRVTIGRPDCRRPYAASIFDISAMSFGALSRNAILALNRGAQAGGFAHNTGEGGISPHHLAHGGDLVWQIGTAYFGCRDGEGRFSPELFAGKACLGGPQPHRAAEPVTHPSAREPVRDQALRSDLSLSGDGGPARRRGAGCFRLNMREPSRPRAGRRRQARRASATSRMDSPVSSMSMTLTSVSRPSFSKAGTSPQLTLAWGWSLPK